MRLDLRRSLACLALLAPAACTTAAPATSDDATTPGTTAAPASEMARSRSAAATGGPVVILVRHAEKGTDSPTDPTLTPEGERRAQELAAALGDAGITHVITTEFRRTQLTAAPLAARLGLTPEVVRAQGTTPHAVAMATAVRRRGPGGVVLVVGHSNTVPAYVAALGGAPVAPICDASHDGLFVLAPVNGRPRLVRARYGAKSPEC